MNLGLRALPYLKSSITPFLTYRPLLFKFSQFFQKQDFKELSDHYRKGINKQFLYHKLVDKWKLPLQRKQRRKQRIKQIAEEKAKNPVQPQSQKLVIHNPALGIQYPPKPSQQFAVIQVDGFQYKVMEDSVILLDTKQNHAINQPVVFERIPLIGTKTFTLLGRPFVGGARVEARVQSISDTSKIIVFKKKRRKQYKRSQGSRATLTQCRITKIVYQLTEDILERAIALT